MAERLSDLIMRRTEIRNPDLPPQNSWKLLPLSWLKKMVGTRQEPTMK
jgi:hypothetical protein